MQNSSTNQNYIGINIGSVSVNVVISDNFGTFKCEKKAHFGNPQQILKEILEKYENGDQKFFGVSGTFGIVSEITAIERALASLEKKYDLILSLGGEAFILYVLDSNGHIVNILSQDKCAAGSGEFFIQQIERLNLPLNEAIDLAEKGEDIQIASRCSVHCKSDITHKLNKGEASIEDVLCSLVSNMINKGIGLIYQSRVNLTNLLIIGGLSLNKVVLQKLRKALPEAHVDKLEFSHVFEAYGTSLLVQDNPEYKIPKLITNKTFSMLPSLHEYGHLVKIMEKPGVNEKFDPQSSYILGIDVGSTTTKAILMHPKNNAIIASHYGRTNGNPIEATRSCLREIIKQTGDERGKISLVGVTGSGRQVVAAYLGTPAVFNEISAHSIGAAYFDSEVDTIFEIGGQDAKYMLLQNGVPVDYAMNASCSAGTGSFLEESAKCDLDIHVYDISDIALKAPKAVRFKADCAAFINSDIRTALQEGYSKQNIISGLVYSIVNNYLNKVKGTRPIGDKIFFQGGVAKNNAVGYAFAQVTGREIIIPPFPELMGAFGIALIAKSKLEKREISSMSSSTTLKSLIEPSLKHLGNFTCKSCDNFCQIENYAVGNRKFPFGGRCTKYEHLWKGQKSASEKKDYVSFRNDLMFPGNVLIDKKKKINEKNQIGIPRALLTHSLFPLFSTFFKEIGYEVVLSDIEPDAELLPNAPLCYPIQILHGAIANLIKQNIKLIFLPYIYRMKKGEGWFDSTFCPISQSSSYLVAPNFEKVEILKPELEFSEGYEKCQELINLAIEKLYIPHKMSVAAYNKAVRHQNNVETQFIKKGREILKKLSKSNDTGIIVVGRSYNVFPKETSQSIPKKITSMGVTVIPFDFLEKKSVTTYPWFFANYVSEAVELVKKHENLFLLYINSYSCTMDAFVQNYVRTEMKSKPYLLMELDAHMADAGTQTRIEAFLEIIKNYRHSLQNTSSSVYHMAKAETENGKAVITTSSGEKLDPNDPRVKIYLPPFSTFHTDLAEKLLTKFGFNMGHTGDIKLEYPVEGLKHCSGKECNPLPAVLGHIMHLVKNREPGEVIGYFMLRGGQPCVVFSYFQFLEQFLTKNRIKDVFIFCFDKYNDFMGVNILEYLQQGPKIVVLGDIMNEIESALEVVGKGKSLEKFHSYWRNFLESFTDIQDINREMNILIQKIKKLPIIGSPQMFPKVCLTGDFFVRFSPFFLHDLKSAYTKNKIIVKSSELFELFTYGVPFGNMVSYKVRDQYLQKIRAKFHGKDRIWNDFSFGFYASQIAYFVMRIIEKRMRKKFEKTGLLFSKPTDIMKIVKNAEPHINPNIFGEAILNIGKGIEIINDREFNGLILIGPQYCLPYRISQAILQPIFIENKYPFLVFDAEITAMSPNMKRLISANIEQINRRFKRMVPVLSEDTVKMEGKKIFL
ncbi:acyl-CoA dehydratase activase [Promethearchaeum syntrophicum]|uniref:Acyl-CoA dehydratase activase n=1 Tax=Promethearchaeum syntrophicum TaxID=2594042 RepID=A0A5B9D5D7_9ARCH|nr:acyl-CoA dehydratase activase [Candidatus Prometheoarchaeum syntrophicum]QEE14272.1 BadF/BadG/BcrA/BcrD ATPase family protein [Candidatus Prometheoarchaeum syntrophicum]